jgi:hypothetical protein
MGGILDPMPTPPPIDEELSLRDRLPEYLATFAVFGAIAALLGTVIAAAVDAALLGGAAYAVMLLGTIFLLAGGASGGGYASIGSGAVGALFGGNTQRVDDDPSDPDVRRGLPSRRDPMERLRRGLRPGRNPRAFWQVIGGLAYLAIGLVVLNALG